VNIDKTVAQLPAYGVFLAYLPTAVQ